MHAAKIVERILISIPVIFGIGIIIFLLMRLTPGDPVDIMMGQSGHGSAREVELLNNQWHLDEPLPVQLGLFLKDVLHGDLGTSFTKGRPVWELIKETLPATIELALGGIFVALLFAIPIGVISAVKQNSLIDRASMTVAFGNLLPHFLARHRPDPIFSVNLDAAHLRRISYAVIRRRLPVFISSIRSSPATGPP